GFSATAWELAEEGTIPNPIGMCPVVPFVNRPSLVNPEGMGEFEDAIDVQDRINVGLLHPLTISSTQAFRQRWATGLQLEDEDGAPIEMFDPGEDTLWAVENDDAKFGDFSQADLRPIIEAIAADVRDCAATTHTPAYYLMGKIEANSGEQLKAADAPLNSKVHERFRFFAPSWSKVQRLIAAYLGIELPPLLKIEWRDPEIRSVAELSDAAVKKQAAGVPWRQRMKDLGYDSETIRDMESQRADDALNALLAAPLPQQNAP